jgi:hypothetical protein
MPDFDYYDLSPGYSWEDVLDFLGIQHYTNPHGGDKAARGFEIRTVEVPDMDEEDQRPMSAQLLVVWPFDKQRPTDEQIRDLWVENWRDA